MRNRPSVSPPPWTGSGRHIFVAATVAVLVTGPAHAGAGGNPGAPGPILQLSPSLVLHGPFSGGTFGVSVAPAFDVDADGYADLLVGDSAGEGVSAAEPGEGVAHCYLGSLTGLASTAVWSAEGDFPNASFGEVLTGAGDVNGDGFGDVLVAAPSWSETLAFEGQVRLYLGSSTGLAATPIWTFGSGQGHSRVGTFLAPLGDVNGDGFADIGLADSEFSLACAFYGSESGLPGAPSWTFPSLGGGQGGMIGVGDVNEDGYDDILVGGANAVGGNTAAWLFRGSATGLLLTPTTTILGPSGGCTYRVAAGGDVQGDGRTDGLLGDVAGKTVRVLRGTSGGFVVSGPTVPNPAGGLGFPDALAGGGDFDRDGFDDALVGDEEASRAWLFRGSATGLGPVAAWQMTTSEPLSAEPSPAFGGAVALLGDTDGDGDCDAAIGDTQGTSSLHPAPNDDGVVYVFDGVPLNGTIPTQFVPGDRLEGTIAGIGGTTTAAFDGVKGMKLELAFDASAVVSKLELSLIDPKGEVEKKLGAKLGGNVVEKTFKLKRSGLYALRIESKTAGPTTFGIMTGRKLPKTALSRTEKLKFTPSSTAVEIIASALPGATLHAFVNAYTENYEFHHVLASLEKPEGGELAVEFELDGSDFEYELSEVTLNTAGRYMLGLIATADVEEKITVRVSLDITQPPLGDDVVQLP